MAITVLGFRSTFNEERYGLEGLPKPTKEPLPISFPSFFPLTPLPKSQSSILRIGATAI